MPGPDRRYETDAERQRAYRERNRKRLQQERAEGQELRELGGQLVEAVHQAAKVGDSLAIAVDRDMPAEVVAELVAHFRRVAGVAPERDEKGLEP